MILYIFYFKDSVIRLYMPFPHGPDKAIYVFGHPIESIISQINRFETCATNPAKLHNDQSFPQFKTIANLCQYAAQHNDFDPFGIAKQFFNFLYAPSLPYPILFVRSDALTQSTQEVADFIGVKEQVNWVAKKRQSSIELLPDGERTCLENLYAPLAAFMNTMPPLLLKPAAKNIDINCGYDDAKYISLKINSVEQAETENSLIVSLTLHNRSHKSLSTVANAIDVIHISYHWLNAQSAVFVIYDGERHAIVPSVYAGYSYTYRVKIQIPSELAVAAAAQYILRVTLVQEQVGWFDEAEPPVFDDVLIEIVGK